MPQDSLNAITTVIAQHFDRELDEPFKRSLEPRVSGWRSTLISRSLEKHPEQRKFFSQTLWVPMECHSRIPCSTPMPICNVMRSKKPIPLPLRYGSELFDYVGTIDGTQSFQYGIPGGLQFNEFSKYARFQTMYEYENQFILLKKKDDQSNMPLIRVDAVFDDASAVFAYNCNTGDCDYWDKPYPVTNDIKQMIIQYIRQVDFSTLKDEMESTPEVEVNTAQPKQP